MTTLRTSAAKDKLLKNKDATLYVQICVCTLNPLIIRVHYYSRISRFCAKAKLNGRETVFFTCEDEETANFSGSEYGQILKTRN